jgi:hypothetical protein
MIQVVRWLRFCFPAKLEDGKWENLMRAFWIVNEYSHFSICIVV